MTVMVVTMTKVYFSDRNTSSSYNMLDKLEHIFKKLKLHSSIKEGERVMIKTHLGLYGNTNYIRPAYIRKTVDLVKAAGGIPFVADTCSLGYGTARPYGGRTTAADYLERAEKNGYTQAVVGAPIIIADGYWGVDTFEIEIDGTFIKKVRVPSALLNCDKVILLSHAKFHHMGIASTLKNMGVGLVGKHGKTAVHSPNGLEIYPEKCKGSSCSACVDACPTRCIEVDDTVTIDMSRCVQCGHCSSVCSFQVKAGALKISWIGKDVQKRIVENAVGVMNSIGADKFYFINLATDISDMCDCVCYGAPLLMHDIGIFGSRDPVAIDHATLSKMKGAPLNPQAEAISKIENLFQNSENFFNHALVMQLGTIDYELVDLSKK